MSEENSRLGLVLVISGPSGAGKTSVCSAIRKECDNLYFSVSCTTRSPRPAETHGEDYYFLSKDEFENRIQNGEFLEYAEVFGNCYGTLRHELIEKVRSGKDVLLDIDFQGASQIRKRCEHDAMLSRCVEYVFIAPPSYEELERRLRFRATETEREMRRRLDRAKVEMEYWREYDYLLVNRDVNETVDNFKMLIDVLHMSTKRLENSDFYEEK